MVGRLVALCAAASLSQAGLAEPAGDVTDREVELETIKFLASVLGSYATPSKNTQTTIIDRRFGGFELDGQQGYWFYTQLNTGADQMLYRQRLYQMIISEDHSEVVQRSFVFKEPGRFENLWDNPAAVLSLSMDDVEPALPQGCDQVWHRGEDGIWRGKVDPETCLIFSQRRQANIRIGADGYYEDGVYATSERGFDEEMNPIWGSKPGEYIIHDRCQSQYCADEAAALAARTR